MRSSSRAALLCLVVLLPGCTIGRWYIGSPLRADPASLVVGATSKGEVLSSFGPPDRILRYRSGDAFIYRHDQLNSSELDIGVPPIFGFGGYPIFNGERTQDKSDQLMVFFDAEGRVSSFGYRQGRDELEPL